jgi:hypothetical protein
MNERARKDQNRQMLRKVDRSIRRAVAAVVADLESHGQRPLIDRAVWRSPEEQKELFDRGLSQVEWGFHCATTPQGRPGSLAADIVDANRFWGASRQFWLRLGSSALEHDLGWGGFWGLPQNLRRGLRTALENNRWRTRVRLGWDVAHVETTRVTIAQARAGRR